MAGIRVAACGTRSRAPSEAVGVRGDRRVRDGGAHRLTDREGSSGIRLCGGWSPHGRASGLETLLATGAHAPPFHMALAYVGLGSSRGVSMAGAGLRRACAAALYDQHRPCMRSAAGQPTVSRDGARDGARFVTGRPSPIPMVPNAQRQPRGTSRSSYSGTPCPPDSPPRRPDVPRSSESARIRPSS